MEDVSDPPFRRLCKLHGADLMYSEFISSEGLIRDAIKSRPEGGEIAPAAHGGSNNPVNVSIFV